MGDTPAAVISFLDEILAVCRRHNLSIAHEDDNGAFLVVPYNAEAVNWLREARREERPWPLSRKLMAAQRG